MGVNHTMNHNFGAHALIFNGKDLREFGVHVSGDGTFTAPERDVECVSIPGRDGDLLVDNGRFLNATVSYSCGITQDFDENFSRMKSWLQREPGYHRLADSYHPDEFRLAAFVAAIKPDLDAYNESGRFSLEFVCKPQRFTAAGDTPVRYYPVACGGLDAVTGGNTVDADMCRLGYIEVTAGADFSFSAVYAEEVAQAAVLAIYDQGKSLLSISTAAAEDGVISFSAQIPVTGHYVQVSWPMGAESVSLRNAGVETAYDDYGAVIRNPESFTSRPFITIGGGENTVLDMNGTRIRIAEYRNVAQCGSISVDCDLQDCYHESKNMNRFVSLFTSEGGIAYEYPAFPPGESTIHTSEYPVATAAEPSIEYMEITPRWWRT